MPTLSTLRSKHMEKKDSWATLFGERVKNLKLEKTDLSQEGFALYVGLERSQYARIERGENDVRLSTIGRIANGYGLTVSELLDGIAGENEPLYEVNPISKKGGK